MTLLKVMSSVKAKRINEVMKGKHAEEEGYYISLYFFFLSKDMVRKLNSRKVKEEKEGRNYKDIE